MTTAPWTPEEVRSLNDYQRCGWLHPFTCGWCRETLGTAFLRTDDGSLRPLEFTDNIEDQMDRYVVLDRHLLATPEGWVCSTCEYTQDWAHDWMADRSWEAGKPPWA